MLGGREDVEAGLVGENGEPAQLVQHLLIAFVVPPDRPQDAFAHRGLPAPLGARKAWNFIERLLLLSLVMRGG